MGAGKRGRETTMIDWKLLPTEDIFIRLDDINAFLGRPYSGSQIDRQTIIRAIKQDPAAPQWIKKTTCYIFGDENGWYLSRP
jgi:hypothetical protein